MTSEPYSPAVRTLFDTPAHAGCVAGGVAHYVEEQGVRLRLSAAVRGGLIDSLRHQVWGCPHLIAAAEAGCRKLEGEPAASLLNFSVDGLIAELGVPAEKTGRMLVFEDAVRALGAAIDRQIAGGQVANGRKASQD